MYFAIPSILVLKSTLHSIICLSEIFCIYLIMGIFFVLLASMCLNSLPKSGGISPLFGTTFCRASRDRVSCSIASGMYVRFCIEGTILLIVYQGYENPFHLQSRYATVWPGLNHSMLQSHVVNNNHTAVSLNLYH